MKQFIEHLQKIIDFKFSTVTAAVCLIAASCSACQFGDYFAGADSANNSASNADGNANSRNASAANNSSPTKTAKKSLCENAYYPIGEKIERKYRVVYQGGAMSPKEYVQTYENIGADKFTERNKFSDVQNALNFQCAADGLRGLQFDNGSNALSTNNNVRAKLETVKSEGLTVPAESGWRAGEKWSGNYTVRSEMQMGGAAGTAEAEIEGKSEIVGEESVTVAAGTFQAFKVQTKTVFRYTSVKVNGASVPMNQTITINTTAWHAKNVGMVKSVMTGTVGGATTELLSITNP